MKKEEMLCDIKSVETRIGNVTDTLFNTCLS